MGKGQWGGSLVPTAEGMGTGDGSWGRQKAAVSPNITNPIYDICLPQHLFYIVKILTVLWHISIFTSGVVDIIMHIGKNIFKTKK